MPLHILAAPDDQQALLDLPWDLPLERWPESHIVALPQGLARHVVRFIRGQPGRIYALKEAHGPDVRKEYDLLRALRRLGEPAVRPVGVINDRTTADGEPLDPVLVTVHLHHSLPYRVLFARQLRADTARRLTDALVVLLVRLHLTGFLWGDCSLSNTLFRRDAGAFAAYLVDAETGELHDRLTDGQREYDLEVAHVNIAGELMDLAAALPVEGPLDPVELAEQVVTTYDRLWDELTGVEAFDIDERWRIARRIERLNELGFDVAELEIISDVGGRTVRIQPKVVDAGHHARRLLWLTGLDVQENQARRLLNDLDQFRAATDQQGEDEEVVAHQWLTEVFEPVVRAIPEHLRGKLEPAEIFHEVLEHRWYLSEAAGHDVGTMAAARSYVDNVLSHRPDEATLLDPPRARRVE